MKKMKKEDKKGREIAKKKKIKKKIIRNLENNKTERQATEIREYAKTKLQ